MVGDLKGKMVRKRASVTEANENFVYENFILLKIFFEDLAEFHVFFKGEGSPQKSPPSKKKGYRLKAETKALLDADTANSKLWTEVTTALQDYPVSIALLRHASKLS